MHEDRLGVFSRSAFVLCGLKGSYMIYPTESDVIRFRTFLQREGECLLFKGSTRRGYGRIQLGGRNGRTVSTHHFAFWLKHGRWPKKLVLHSCDNKRCCEAKHLREGTHLENMEDRERAGRTARGDVLGKRLNQEAAESIRRLYAAGGVTQKELAKRFGVSRPMIGYIVRGEWWT